MSVLIAVREFGNTEGSNKIGIADWGLIQYPWGMHIRGYEEKEENKRNSTGFKTWYASGIPCN